jgi:hypothetical protein
MTDQLNNDLADLRQMLDVIDQMVQATSNQVAMLPGGAGASGAATTGATETMTDTAETGAMGMGLAVTGMFNTEPMLPVMAQNLQTMSSELRTMLDNLAAAGTAGATGTGEAGATTTTTDTATTTDTTGTPTGAATGDTMLTSLGGPSVSPILEMMGHSLA